MVSNYNLKVPFLSTLFLDPDFPLFFEFFCSLIFPLVSLSFLPLFFFRVFPFLALFFLLLYLFLFVFLVLVGGFGHLLLFWV